MLINSAAAASSTRASNIFIVPWIRHEFLEGIQADLGYSRQRRQIIIEGEGRIGSDFAGDTGDHIIVLAGIGQQARR